MTLHTSHFYSNLLTLQATIFIQHFVFASNSFLFNYLFLQAIPCYSIRFYSNLFSLHGTHFFSNLWLCKESIFIQPFVFANYTFLFKPSSLQATHFYSTFCLCKQLLFIQTFVSESNPFLFNYSFLQATLCYSNLLTLQAIRFYSNLCLCKQPHVNTGTKSQHFSNTISIKNVLMSCIPCFHQFSHLQLRSTMSYTQEPKHPLSLHIQIRKEVHLHKNWCFVGQIP